MDFGGWARDGTQRDVCRSEVLRDGSNKVLFRFVEALVAVCVFPCK